MKSILVVLALVSSTPSDAGGSRPTPEPTSVRREFTGVDDGSAKPNLSEGRSVHDDSDRDEAHVKGNED